MEITEDQKAYADALMDKMENLRNDARDTYKKVLHQARTYFLLCQELKTIPPKGLQRIVYDLGSVVNTNGLKTGRILAQGIELANRLYDAGFFR